MQSVASLWFRSALLPQGWAANVRLALEGGRIARIEPGVQPAPGDEQHAIAIPGMPNVHSHAFQRAMAGLTKLPAPARTASGHGAS